MASLQIEGDTGSATERQIQFIRDVLEKRGFTNNRVVFEAAGKAGDNYVADVKRITVIVDGGEDFKMIAKFAPENEMLRKMMNTNILFSNEILMYEEILPKLVSLQRDGEVPEDGWLRFAECYGTLAEEPYEVVLLEDLNVSNFIMLDRFTSLDNDAVRLVLKNFAILHSLSYALKKLEPETYGKFTSNLLDMWELTKDTEEFQGFMTKLEEDALNVVDDNYKKALPDTVSQFPIIYGKIMKADKHSKHLVILQGDSWTNNILFMLKDNKAAECVMIDYQLSFEKNPVCDILYFLFSSTDSKTRSKYYNDWIDYYHQQLDKSLSNFGMTATNTFSRDHLDVDLKRYSKLFFGNSVMLSSILCRNSEEAKVIQDAMKDQAMDKMEDLGLVSNDTLQLYKSRVEGLIDNYREFGYIK